jgi:hypothetical protein
VLSYDIEAEEADRAGIEDKKIKILFVRNSRHDLPFITIDSDFLI